MPGKIRELLGHQGRYGIEMGAEVKKSDASGYGPFVSVRRGRTLADVGFESPNGVVTTLIEAGTTVPTQVAQLVSTAEGHQDMMELPVVEGGSAPDGERHRLGRFQLAGIPGNRAVKSAIEVTLALGADGRLEVSAQDWDTKSYLTVANVDFPATPRSKSVRAERADKAKAAGDRGREKRRESLFSGFTAELATVPWFKLLGVPALLIGAILIFRGCFKEQCDEILPSGRYSAKCVRTTPQTRPTTPRPPFPRPTPPPTPPSNPSAP